MEKNDKIEGSFCICTLSPKGYEPNWHNITSFECWILALQIGGPKWHLETSSRVVGVFNYFLIL
jgi:hypothetical protein